MNSTYGAAVVAKNDDYGGNLIERATYALNSMLKSFDEVFYVDWGSEGISLIEELKHDLSNKHKLKYIEVSPEKSAEILSKMPNPQGIAHQSVLEQIGRNMGLRRLNTDFLVSTNIDVLVPSNEQLIMFTQTDLLSPGPKRMISLEHVRAAGSRTEDVHSVLVRDVEENREPFCTPGYGQQGEIHGDDKWSLVNGCGDFQIGHRDVWYGIKGFEESLIGRGYGDTNVHKKATLYGFEIGISYGFHVFHIGHDGGIAGGGGGSVGDWNDPLFAVWNFNSTTNTDSWGMIDEDFEVKTL